MPVRVYLLKHTPNETLERTTGEQDSGLEPEDPNKRLLKEPSLLPKANMINKRFQYVCLVYKPHPRFLAQNLSQKVRLIHECLRYYANTLGSDLSRAQTCSGLFDLVP